MHDEYDELDEHDELDFVVETEQHEQIEVIEQVDVYRNLFLNDNKMNKKLYVYVKNWKIMWSSTCWTLKLWQAIEVEYAWYYRIVNWELVCIKNDEEVLDTDVLVWDRNRNEYYEKRKEICNADSIEETRATDEAKETDYTIEVK